MAHAREVVVGNVRAVDLVVHLLVDNNVLVIVVEYVEGAKGIVRGNVMVALVLVSIHVREIVLEDVQVVQELVVGVLQDVLVVVLEIVIVFVIALVQIHARVDVLLFAKIILKKNSLSWFQKSIQKTTS